MSRIAQQFAFLAEADKVKHIFRRNYLTDASRHENDAEHMWHLVLMACVLHEHAPAPRPDLLHVIQMLAIHDLVEIDAGDCFAYDAAANVGKYERECLAADRVFGLLPADQRDAYRALWEEFEASETPAARFANALDRLSPLLLNTRSGGRSYREHGITPAMIEARNKDVVSAGTPELWPEVEGWVRELVEAGVFDLPTQQEH